MVFIWLHVYKKPLSCTLRYVCFMYVTVKKEVKKEKREGVGGGEWGRSRGSWKFC